MLDSGGIARHVVPAIGIGAASFESETLSEVREARVASEVSAQATKHRLVMASNAFVKKSSVNAALLHIPTKRGAGGAGEAGDDRKPIKCTECLRFYRSFSGKTLACPNCRQPNAVPHRATKAPALALALAPAPSPASVTSVAEDAWFDCWPRSALARVSERRMTHYMTPFP